jgi:hypothetical protein
MAEFKTFKTPLGRRKLDALTLAYRRGAPGVQGAAVGDPGGTEDSLRAVGGVRQGAELDLTSRWCIVVHSKWRRHAC